MSDNPKIITSFQERLALDTALRNLSETESDAELRQQAAEIAETYGQKTIPALLSLLDTTDAQLRGGLGHVAAQLDAAQIVPSLSAIARDQTQPPQARMAAIAILERYLGVAPDDSMYANLGDTEALALQSLREALAEAERDPWVLLDYLGQLSLEPHDVLLAMVRATRQLEGAKAVKVLRLFAQDPFVPAAQEALQILGDIADEEAAAALRTLLPILSPKLRSLAERSTQKLRLRGVSVDTPAPPPAGARCLASPLDSRGNQVLLFEVPDGSASGASLLRVLINAVEGILDAGGSLSGSPRRDPRLQVLPERAAPGVLHQPDDETRRLPWLEAPFDYGRQRVLDAHRAHGLAGHAPPLIYRLLNPLLWQWQSPQPKAERSQPAAADPEATLELLQHPAMVSWFLQSPASIEAAQHLLAGSEPATSERFEQLAQSTLAQDVDGEDQLVAVIEHSLLDAAAWLDLAGEPDAADLARATAASLHGHPETHPFLLELRRRGLRLALIGLARRQGFPSAAQ